MEVPPNYCTPMMTKWQLLSKEEGGGQHNNDLGRRSPWWGWRKEQRRRLTNKESELVHKHLGDWQEFWWDAKHCQLLAFEYGAEDLSSAWEERLKRECTCTAGWGWCHNQNVLRDQPASIIFSYFIFNCFCQVGATIRTFWETSLLQSSSTTSSSTAFVSRRGGESGKKCSWAGWGRGWRPSVSVRECEQACSMREERTLVLLELLREGRRL